VRVELGTGPDGNQPGDDPPPATTADGDGTFAMTISAPDRLGRYRLRAVCPGRALQSWLDVAQTTTERPATTPVAMAAVTTVGAVLAFSLLSGFLLGLPSSRR
jgi:hypothetical protein